MPTKLAILRRSYSIARGKPTEVQSIYRIYQEMLWLLHTEYSGGDLGAKVWTTYKPVKMLH
jgi:hypothetical protein